MGKYLALEISKLFMNHSTLHFLILPHWVLFRYCYCGAEETSGGQGGIFKKEAQADKSSASFVKLSSHNISHIALVILQIYSFIICNVA